MTTKKDTGEFCTELIQQGIIKVATKPKVAIPVEMAELKKKIEEIITLTDSTITKFDWLWEYDIVCSWLLDNKGRGLILLGDNGRGKSLFATKVIPVLLKMHTGNTVRPISSYQMQEEYDKIIRAPFVIIDDVGEEPTINDFGNKYEIFSRVVDYCEKNSMLLIITTNLTSKQIMARYGVRTIDRLDKLCKVVIFTGQSYRK